MMAPRESLQSMYSLFAMLFVAVPVLTACGSDSNGPAQSAVTTTVLSLSAVRETVTSVSTQTITASSTQAAPNTSAVDLGVQAASGGVNLTVNSFSVVPEYVTTYNQQTENVQPRSGGKFVRVDTTVVNNTKGGIDLTCSWPVATKVVDLKERQFDPVDDLYKIDGHPGCNDLLQPGFDSPMTWIFEVPVDADVAGFAFRDTDLNRTLPQDAEWAVVRALAGV